MISTLPQRVQALISGQIPPGGHFSPSDDYRLAAFGVAVVSTPNRRFGVTESKMTKRVVTGSSERRTSWQGIGMGDLKTQLRTL